MSEINEWNKTGYRDLQRICELEAQLAAQRERVSRYEEGYQGSCYACEPVGLRNIALEAELAAEREKVRVLRESLLEAADCIADWGAYAGDYFQKKHGLDEEVARFKAAAQEVE